VGVSLLVAVTRGLCHSELDCISSIHAPVVCRVCVLQLELAMVGVQHTSCFVESAAGAVAALRGLGMAHHVQKTLDVVCRVCCCYCSAGWTAPWFCETVLVGATFIRGVELRGASPSVQAPVVWSFVVLFAVCMGYPRLCVDAVHCLESVELRGPSVACASCMAVSARGAYGTLCV
jgi:hypothetical protein